MNVQIRHATPTDYEAVTRLFSGPKAIGGTFQLPYPSPELWRKRLAEPEAGLTSLVAMLEDDLVGTISLHTYPQQPRRRHASRLGMAVRDDHQGQGVGTALMQAAIELAECWMNLTRLELEVFTDNEPAIRLYKKFDFVVEGTLRQFAFRDGQFVDAYAMARLRSSVASPPLS